MAFQNYRPIDLTFSLEFVGLQKFQQLFLDATLRVIRNTLAMGVINLVLLLPQLHLQSFSMRHEIQLGKTADNIVPAAFLSWIIVTGIIHDALSGTGIIVNELFT